MDQFGELFLSSTVGFNGRCAKFISRDTICFIVGNALKFINTSTKVEHCLYSPGDSIQSFAVNALYETIAFSDEGLESSIYVYDIDDLSKPKVVIPGFSLGFCILSFANNGSILATCSNIPEVKLTLWNWIENIELCSLELNTPLTSLQFNPTNWHQLCGINGDGLKLWNIEQVNEQYSLQCQDVTFPCIDGTFGLEDTDVNKISSSKQGDSSDRLIGQLFCWFADNKILSYCNNHQLIVVDSETGYVDLLQPLQDDDGVNNIHSQITCLQSHQDGFYFGNNEDGILRYLKIKEKHYLISSVVDIKVAITCIDLTMNEQHVALSNAKGQLFTHNIKNSLLEPLIDHEHGKVIGVGCLSTQYYVSCKDFGLLETRTVKNSLLVGSLHLSNYQITCLVTNPSSTTVFLGTHYGSIVVIDVIKPSAPRFVYELFLHKAPLTVLSIDQTGSVLISGSTDCNVYIINARVSTKLNILGYTIIPGHVMCISVRNIQENSLEGPWKALIGVASSDHKPACNQLIELCFTNEIIKGNGSLYMDQTKLLKDVSINKKNHLLKSFVYDIVIVSKDVAFAIVHQGKKIAKYLFDEKEETFVNMVMDCSTVYPGHGLNGGHISLSCHGKWLLTGSMDGYIIVRAVGAMNNPVTLQASNYRTGGISHVTFTSDAQGIIAVGNDGTTSCWNWQFTSLGKAKATVAVDAYRSLHGFLKAVQDKEDNEICKMKSLDANKELVSESTWLEQTVDGAHKKEDQQYSAVKNKLREDIDTLRSRVLSMILTNENVPEIERLNRQEFNMDIEERQKMVSDREKKLAELRAQMELENTKNQYIHHLIKQECWDDMKVKGKSVKSFVGSTEVSNYPIKEQTAEEIAELEFVLQQRQIENIEKDVRSTVLATDMASHKSLVESSSKENGDDETMEGDTKKDLGSTYGSLGFMYGGANPLLYSQFNLRTRNQKKHQKILIKSCIQKMKEHFNQLFDDLYNNKAVEVRRINDRNERIKKILSDMGNTEQTVEEVSLCDIENPECFLTVNEDEIKVEKYLSEEERRKIEEELSLEEQRRLGNSDNSRGRALDMMMAGRLETNLEEELKKDIEQPEFMCKPEQDWSEEEIKMAKEHEKKITQLQEDREKYRKSLETELKKLQAANSEVSTNFNEKLQQLFQLKIKTETVILQEELKIVRITSSMLTDEVLESKEKELLNHLEGLKDRKQSSSLKVGDAKREVEAFRDAYETLCADDKTLDKMFRKEFMELDTHTVDQLYRLFKRRPRAQRTLKAAVESQADVTPSDENPFHPRPSSSRAASAAAQVLEKAMLDLDSEHHMPENVEIDSWRKLVMLRRTKVEKEQQLKSEALVLADMTSYLQKQIDRDEDLKLSIEKTFEDIQRVREERLHVNLNLEVQLLVKQGQVEVENNEFVPSYDNALLIHRSAVEDLNTTILTLGRSKLASMYESKDFRKGIHQLAWQLKEMFMRAEDAETAAQDLQLLRVTKELQVYLSDTDQRQSKQQEIATLEKTFEMYQHMQQRKVQDKRRCVRKLRHQINEKSNENNELDYSLEELSLSVAERRTIDEANDDDDKSGKAERMNDIITRRKLVDLAKAQASEIGLLRSEVERLRMRTFPALLQVDLR